jgi:hypothetical protein
MNVRKMLLWNAAGLRRFAGVAIDLALLVTEQARVQAVMSLDSPHHTNLDETMQRKAQHCENVNNILSELKGDNWAKSAS